MNVTSLPRGPKTRTAILITLITAKNIGTLWGTCLQSGVGWKVPLKFLAIFQKEISLFRHPQLRRGSVKAVIYFVSRSSLLNKSTILIYLWMYITALSHGESKGVQEILGGLGRVVWCLAGHHLALLYRSWSTRGCLPASCGTGRRWTPHGRTSLALGKSSSVHMQTRICRKTWTGCTTSNLQVYRQFVKVRIKLKYLECNWNARTKGRRSYEKVIVQSLGEIFGASPHTGGKKTRKYPQILKGKLWEILFVRPFPDFFLIHAFPRALIDLEIHFAGQIRQRSREF